VRHVREADDHRDREDRIDVPRHALRAEQFLEPHRVEADRAGRDHVAEREHHRRHEHGREQQRFEPAAAGQVGAHHQECEDAAERDRDEQHPAGDDERVLHGRPEVGVAEDETEAFDAERLAGVEERRGQQALEQDEAERQRDRDGQHRDDDPAQHAGERLQAACGQRGNRVAVAGVRRNGGGRSACAG